MGDIIVEAETLEEARAQVAARIPPGEFLISETVESDGQPKSVRGSGQTADEALAKLHAQVPQGATILENRVLADASVRTVAVVAADEFAASQAALVQTEKEATVVSVIQTEPRKRGILGIGRRAPGWQVEVLCWAQMEIRYKTAARIVAQTGTRPENWEQLLGAIRAIKGGTSGRQLSDALPYHVQFILLVMKLDEPAYYRQIPFLTVTSDMVRRAKQYIEDPKLQGMLAIFPGKLDPDRFRVLEGGQIGRMTNLATDSSIVSTASCLQRQPISMLDPAAAGRLAFDAIRHYASLPTVRFCFSLPYIHDSLGTRQIDPMACQVEVYKATEALLLEIWDELAEGGLITDERVVDKARRILSGN